MQADVDAKPSVRHFYEHRRRVLLTLAFHILLPTCPPFIPNVFSPPSVHCCTTTPLGLLETTTPPSPPLSPPISPSRRFASLLDSLDEIAMGFALSSIRGKRPYTRPSLRSRFNGDYNNPRDSWRGERKDLSRGNLLLVYY